MRGNTHKRQQSKEEKSPQGRIVGSMFCLFWGCEGQLFLTHPSDFDWQNGARVMTLYIHSSLMGRRFDLICGGLLVFCIGKGSNTKMLYS